MIKPQSARRPDGPTGGFHSDVLLSDDRRVITKITPRSIDPGLTFDQAKIRRDRIVEYQDRLRSKGIKVVPPVSADIIPASHRSRDACFRVRLVEPYCGESLALRIRNSPPEQAPTFARRLLSAVSPLLGNGEEWNDVGIDAKVDNFVVSDTGDLVYVDLTPPRVGRPSQSTPFEGPGDWGFQRWKYHTPEGIVLVALTHLGRARPDAFPSLRSCFLYFLRNGGWSELCAAIEAFDSVETDEVPLNPVAVRLSACAGASAGYLDQLSLERLYELTHHEGPLPASALRLITEALRSSHELSGLTAHRPIASTH